MLLVCELNLVTVGVVAERRVHVALERKAMAVWDYSGWTPTNLRVGTERRHFLQNNRNWLLSLRIDLSDRWRRWQQLFDVGP